MKIIETAQDVAEGATWLVAREPKFASVMGAVGIVPLRRRPDGFAALLNAIVSQQVSVASAAAIWARCDAAGLVTEAAICAASDADLRACGFSRPKMRYARALAEAGIDYVALRGAPDEEVIARLVAVTGIGRWTAEIYAMFALGRRDVFAPGDLALQEAARVVFALNARPSESEMRVMAEHWSPWRAVAARALFAYYRVIKAREGIL